MSITFQQIDKAMKVKEIVEYSKDFNNWAKKNKKSPENFCDWGLIISDYYKEKDEDWSQPVAINFPFGFMGYEIFYPPKPEIIEIKPIGFENGDNDMSFDMDLFLCESSDEEGDE